MKQTPTMVLQQPHNQQMFNFYSGQTLYYYLYLLYIHIYYL